MNRFQGILLFFILASLLAPASAAPGGGPSTTPPGLEALLQDSHGKARVGWHRATGVARFVSLEPESLPVDGSSSRSRAGYFLRRYGSVFGLREPARELSAPREHVDRYGGIHLKYSQLYHELPVFAGEIRVHFDPRGHLTAVNGTFIPDIALDIRPLRSDSQAGMRAVEMVREELPPGIAAGVQARRTRLLIYRTGLARGVEGINHLAYEVEVGDGAGVREFIFVDARTGKVIDRLPGIHSALDRRIHEVQFGAVIWTEGESLPYDTGDPPNDAQVNDLIDYSEDIYDLFSNLSGGAYLSWDGSDATLHSVWDIPSAAVSCPNAFWDGAATNFCNGVTGDDTVAHEWAHAYTERTHNLIYQWQPGALNEAYSDIFGEVADLLNGAGLDSPGPPRSTGSCSTFAGPGPPSLEVHSPASIAGFYPVGGAEFNPTTAGTVTADIQLVNDGDDEGGTGTVTDGCQALVGFTPGRIALIDRGACTFISKVVNAQDAGAAAVIIVNNAGDGILEMGGGGATINIFSVFLGQSDGTSIKGQLGTGVNATIGVEAPVDVSYRWLSGEDDPAFGGAIRDMWNPTCFGDPGKISDSQFYVCSGADNGGVHSNSGIPNHAFALLSDGGSSNGRTVTALGLTKTTHLYWRAMELYQGPASDFADHADALEQSCADLMGVNLPDLLSGAPSGEVIGAADCTQLSEAMLAVEMRTDPSFCNFQPLLDPTSPAVDCGATVFLDDFEADPTGAWSLSNQGVFGPYLPRDWQWTATIPAGGTGSAFFGLDSLTLGDCNPGSDDQSGVMHLDSPEIVLPLAEAVLTFDHYVATEYFWDGGNLKISVNGGLFQPVDPADFRFNGYNGTLATTGQGNTNPLAGEAAFTGANEGELQGSWGQSQVDLSPYASAGDTVQLRFSLGVDGCNGLDGWYVDNVGICLDCSSGVGGTDGDLDGARLCEGDCDDANDSIFPDAPEVNDGLDNQCAGDAAFGIIDEITGHAGFFNPADLTELSWPAQTGATSYQVARSTAPDFSQDCTTFDTTGPVLLDSETPTGGIFFYLVRPLTPNIGSWGMDSTGSERLFTCGP